MSLFEANQLERVTKRSNCNTPRQYLTVIVLVLNIMFALLQPFEQYFH